MPGALPPRLGRVSDAHDRQPVENRFAKMAAKKKEKDDGFFASALHKVEGVAHHVGNVAATTAKVARYVPAVNFGMRLAKVKNASDLGKIVGGEFAEESGLASAYRIRHGRGDNWDKAAVATMAIPFVGRAAMAAKAAKPALHIISPEMAKSLQASGGVGAHIRGHDFGEVTAAARRGAAPLPEGGEAGLRHGGVYRLPKAEHDPRDWEFEMDNGHGFSDRMPWIADQDNQMVFVGNPGELHANIFETLAAKGILRDPGSMSQGFIRHKPDEWGGEPLQYIVAGDRRAMGNKALNTWLQLLTRNLGINDEHVAISELFR